MKIEHLLMDADGVIINTKEYFSVKYCRERNLHQSVLDEFFQTHWYEIVCGRKDLKLTIQPYLKNFRWNGSLEEYIDFWFNSESNLDNQLLEFIFKLKSHIQTLNLATNQESYRLDYFRTSLNLEDYFDNLYASCDMGFKKPDPEFYQILWENLGKPVKKSVLFWDDTPTNIFEAKRFGFRGEVYTNFEKFKQVMNNDYDL